MSRPRPGRRPTPRANPVPTPCDLEPHGATVNELFRMFGRTHMLDVLGVFVEEAGGEPRRFVDLQKRLDLSPNTLAERLRELVAAGFLTRTSYNEIPPRVDYQATRKALDLAPVFEFLHGWAARHTLEPAPAAPTARGAV